MNTTVRGAKVRQWGNKIRSLTGGSSTPSDHVLPLKQKLTRIDLAIKALPASGAPSATPAVQGLLRIQTDLDRRVGLLSPTSDKSTLGPYEIELRKLESDTTSAASFLLEYEKAFERKCRLQVLSPPGNPPHEKPVQDKMEEADGLAAQGKMTEAAVQLKLTDTLAKNQSKAAGELAQATLSDARLKPLYDNKVARIQRAIDELAPLPGTAAARKKLADLLTAGGRLATTGNYKRAYDALEGLSGALDSGRKAAAQFDGKVGDPAFRGLLTQTRQDLQAYADLLPLTSPEAAADLENRLNRLLQQQDTTPPPTDLTAAKSALGTIGQEIKRGLDGLQRHAQDWEMLFGEVDTKVAMLRKAAPTDVFEGVLAAYRACTTLHGLRNDQQGVIDLRKLNLRCNELLLVHEPVRSKWDELSKTVDTVHLQKLQAVLERSEFELRRVADPLFTAYNNARITVPNTRDFPAAVTAAEAVIDQVPRLIEPLLLRIEGLEDQRLEGRRQVDEAKKALQLQIDALVSAGGDTTAARLALTTGSNGWGTASLTASTSSALDDILRSSLKTLNDAATLVRTDLAEPARLSRSKDARLAAERQAGLDQATAAVNLALKRLLEEYPDDARPLVDLREELLRLARAETTASRPVMQQQVAQMNELANRARTELDKRLREAAGVVDAARQAATAASQRVKALKGKNGEFETFFKALEAEVQDAAAMADSSVHQVVAAGLAQLSAGGAVFDRLTALENSNDFTQVKWLFDDLDDMFGNDTLKTCKPVLLKTLKKRLKAEVRPNAHAQSPAQAVQVLGGFRQEVMQAQSDANQAETARREIATLKAEAKLALAGLSKSDSPKVREMLAARIEAAGTVVEGREYESKSQLTALKVTLGRLTSDAPGVDTQLLEMERQITAREFNDKKAKAQWEAKADLFDKNEARLAKTAHDETPSASRDAARYAEIDRLRKEATKLAGKGQYADALQRLAGAVNEARDFVANPFNGATSARKDLTKAGTRWASAVSTFVGKLTDLREAIEKQSAADVQAEPTTDLAPYTAATKAVSELASCFNPEHFTGVIESLSREGLNLTQVRTAKESALRLLRACRDTLASDPMLKQVAVNPFGAPVPLKPLADRLNDLDLNFQRF